MANYQSRPLLSTAAAAWPPFTWIHGHIRHLYNRTDAARKGGLGDGRNSVYDQLKKTTGVMCEGGGEGRVVKREKGLKNVSED